MHHGRTQPFGYIPWQAEVSLCKSKDVLLSGGHRTVQGTWLRWLKWDRFEVLIPDLRCTHCILYEMTLHGFPSSFKTDLDGKHDQVRESAFH